MTRARLISDVGGAWCAVVRMTEHDLLEVVEIEESTGLSQWGWDAYRAELEKPEAIMLVARRDAQDAAGRNVIGYIASRLSAGELHINNIGVRPESRRRGVGNSLMRAALDEASRGGARLAVLEVRAGNRAAIALYERQGFAVVGERRNYYRSPTEDAKIMTRVLAAGA